WSARQAPGTPTRATSSARARRTPGSSSRTTPTSPTSWRSASWRSSASVRPWTPRRTASSPTTRALTWMASTSEPADDRDLGPEADPESVARKILLDQLTGRARSRSELATKLRKRGVPEEVGIRLLDRFEEVGLVDDAAYA